jgi:hypothetical protein
MKGIETMKKRQTKQHITIHLIPQTVSQPSPEKITKRVHEIFLACGGAPGFELDNWLQAERELKAASLPLPEEISCRAVRMAAS